MEWNNIWKRTFSLLGVPILEVRYHKEKVEYFLFSCLPVYRRELQVDDYFKKKEVQVSNKSFSVDDTQLLSELRTLGAFAYQPNDGNMGDALIAAVTMRWMDDHHLQWHRLKEHEQPECLVYGGGGIWTSSYVQNTRSIMQKMQQAKRILILPSSFHDVPEFISILDERFVVFCREQKSYDYLLKQNTKSRILLDHDMALRANAIQKPPCWKTNKKNKFIRRLRRNIAELSCAPKLYRVDAESTSIRVESEFDLSGAMDFRPCDSRASYELGAWALCSAVSCFRHIYTDRLHVGIAALLCGVQVTYRDNSYGKIRAVYAHSLKDVPLVDMEDNLKADS